MTMWKPWPIVAALAVAVGCGESPKAVFPGGGEYVTPDGDDSGEPDTDPPPPDDDPPDDNPDLTDDSGLIDDTGEEGEEMFDNPGDTKVVQQDDRGKYRFDLSDKSGESNQDQEFYLVVVNASEDAVGYTLRYIPTAEDDEEAGDGEGGDAPDEGGADAPDGGGEPPDGGGEPPDGGGEPPDGGGEPPDGGGEPPPGMSILDDGVVEIGTEGTVSTVAKKAKKPWKGLTKYKESKAGGPPPPSEASLDDTDIGIARRVFRVRRDMQDSSECEVIDATLWAIGDYAAIWVDGDVPIDHYYDCDDKEEGGLDPSDYEAHGFDNCDLETIVNIVDTNIMPNVTSLLGEPSDEDGNGLVSVVISPVLNVISLTSGDEDEYEDLVESYTDPATDLDDFSADENPCSDEQEVVYVYAPDPYGHYNPYATVTVDEYTGMELAGRIVQGMAGLISYNQHVIVNEGDEEEQWVTAGIGAVATDITGFGAIFYADAWDYMDATHLNSLLDDACESSEEEGGSKSEGGGEDSVITTEKRGAQYLFFRWLVDSFGEEILATMVQSESTACENIEAATEEEMKTLVTAWQVAMLTTDLENADGDELMDSSVWDMYGSASLISAPIDDPEPGDKYGANGYQLGIDVNGTNLYMDGGTTAEPEELTENAVKIANSDHFTYVAAIPFSGYVAANYGAHIIRLKDIPYEEATLEIQSSSSDLTGVIIRWNDPESVDYMVENVFSATDANNMPLPTLPDDGRHITGLGTISEPGVTLLINDGGEEAVDVYDTDRWLLDLTDRDASEEIELAITVDRRFENTEGDISPYDLWVSVVPENLVPSPTVDGTRRGDCDEGDDFAYPASVLQHLFYQMLVSGESGSTGVVGGFDPCGAVRSGDTASIDSGWSSPGCGTDWDRDDVLDLDEPRPSSFLEQVMVMQCTLAGGDFSEVEAYEASDIIDLDTMDENDDPYVDRTRNLGGRSGGEAEEAYLETTLAGGATYVVVVGAGTETGPYELRIKEID